MPTNVRVNAMGLDAILKDAQRFEQEAREIVEDGVGEMWLDFEDELTGGVVRAPGAGFWAVKTGRSVKGWRPLLEERRKGSWTFSASNSVPYAPYVRKSGERIGRGVEIAQDRWATLSRRAAEDIADDIEEFFKGDR